MITSEYDVQCTEYCIIPLLWIETRFIDLGWIWTHNVKIWNEYDKAFLSITYSLPRTRTLHSQISHPRKVKTQCGNSLGFELKMYGTKTNIAKQLIQHTNSSINPSVWIQEVEPQLRLNSDSKEQEQILQCISSVALQFQKWSETVNNRETSRQENVC